MKPITINPSIAIRNQFVVLVDVEAGAGAGVVLTGAWVVVVAVLEVAAVVVAAVVEDACARELCGVNAEAAR
jgi:hypothetical protein